MSTASVPNTFASAVTATGLQLDQNYNTIVAYINNPQNRNNWATDSGNTNTIVLTFVPPVQAYSAGLEITFKAAFTNTGATVINANALGNQNFVQPGGGALASGQIQANGVYKAAHNGSAFVYIGQNVLAASAADVVTATSAITFVSPSTLPAAAASQANLETATATVGFMTPANAKYYPGVAKAWAAFNGTNTGTISALSSFNVSSIERLGAGTYAITFASPFSSANYVVGGSGGIATSGTAVYLISTNLGTQTFTLTTLTPTGGATDTTRVAFVCFGDLP